ncbi:MAG: PKD domain-containing protein [Candidatus Thermoplasmatota archaeon]
MLPSFSFSNSFAISFEALQNEAYTGEAIHFKVSINDYKEENKEQWYYYILELGDGSNKTGFANTNPFYISCAYSKEGIYYPKISVKNGNEWMHKSLSEPIKIEKGNIAPIAKIKYYGNNKVGEKIKFDASESYDEDGSIINYTWKFGDGSIAYDKIVEHSYNKPGCYTVILTVIDDKGSKNFDAIRIEILGINDDPSQEDTSGGFVKIYSGKSYAQSFIPSPNKQGMVGLYIYVSKKTLSSDETNENNGLDNNQNKISSSSINPNSNKILDRLHSLGRFSIRDFISFILNNFVNINKRQQDSTNGGSTRFSLLSDLRISIMDDLNGKIIATKYIKADEVERSGGWLYVDFSSSNVLFDLKTLGKKQYYIVLSTSGGNEFIYYKWYYSNGDVYSNGSAYEKISEWQSLGYDFAFKVVGARTGNEPDGIVDKWAIVIGVPDYEGKCGTTPAYYVEVDAKEIADLLEASGWNVVRLIEHDATYQRLIKEIRNIEGKEDFDDIFLFFFGGHGEKGDVGLDDCYGFSGENINYYLKNFASSKQVFIFDSCLSGAFITYAPNSIAKEGRIVLTSSQEDEFSYGALDLKHGIFSYYIIEALSGKGDGTPIPPDFKGAKDGYVSAEEAFYYAKPKVEARNLPGYEQHPQIYDGIEGEVWLTKV